MEVMSIGGVAAPLKTSRLVLALCDIISHLSNCRRMPACAVFLAFFAGLYYIAY